MPADYIPGYTGHRPGAKLGPSGEVSYVTQAAAGPGKGFVNKDNQSYQDRYNSRAVSKNVGQRIERYTPSVAERAVSRGGLDLDRQHSSDSMPNADNDSQNAGKEDNVSDQGSDLEYQRDGQSEQRIQYEDRGARLESRNGFRPNSGIIPGSRLNSAQSGRVSINGSNSGDFDESNQQQQLQQLERSSILKAKEEHYAQGYSETLTSLFHKGGEVGGAQGGGGGRSNNGTGHGRDPANGGRVDMSQFEQFSRSRSPIPGYAGHIPKSPLKVEDVAVAGGGVEGNRAGDGRDQGNGKVNLSQFNQFNRSRSPIPGYTGHTPRLAISRGGGGDDIGIGGEGNGMGEGSAQGIRKVDLSQFNRSRSPIPGYTGHVPGYRFDGKQHQFSAKHTDGGEETWKG